MGTTMRVWLGFTGLCLLAGSRWLVDAAAPSLLPAGPRAAVHFGLIAVSFVMWALVRRVGAVEWARVGWVVGLAGAATFALPAAIVAGAGSRVPGLTEELLFLLTPVIVIFVVAQESGFGQEEDVRRLLGPALAGIAGAALLVPFRLPTSAVGMGWLAGLVLAVAVSGVAAVRLHRELQRVQLIPALATIAAVCAGVAALAPGWEWVGGLSVAEWAVEGGKALLLDGPMLVLGVWCLREMSPVRFSSRVLLILLVAIAGSFVAARPAATWTMAAGAVMMAGGAGWLLKDGSARQQNAG